MTWKGGINFEQTKLLGLQVFPAFGQRDQRVKKLQIALDCMTYERNGSFFWIHKSTHVPHHSINLSPQKIPTDSTNLTFFRSLLAEMQTWWRPVVHAGSHVLVCMYLVFYRNDGWYQNAKSSLPKNNQSIKWNQIKSNQIKTSQIKSNNRSNQSIGQSYQSYQP